MLQTLFQQMQVQIDQVCLQVKLANRLSRDRSPVYAFKNHKKAHNNTYPCHSVASSYSNNYCIVLIFHVSKCSQISVKILQMLNMLRLL